MQKKPFSLSLFGKILIAYCVVLFTTGTVQRFVKSAMEEANYQTTVVNQVVGNIGYITFGSLSILVSWIWLARRKLKNTLTPEAFAAVVASKQNFPAE